jgi:ATP-dependent Clp protease ATP-binding subunit ClpA
MASAKEEPMRPRPALPFPARIRKVAVRSRSGGTFGRFTDHARQAVFHASQEAQLLRHRHVGTEHLLLGLIFDDAGLAAQALESLGLSLGDVRYQVTQITGHGEHAPPEHIPFTPQAKRAMELALREALGLGDNYVGTEHLLLGLLRVERGIAALVLTRLGADYGRVRDRVAELTNLREQADQEAQAGRQPTRAELADVAQRLDRVRTQKEDALSAEDFEAALALRDREKELLATKTRLERQLAGTPQAPDMLAAVLAENQRLHRELDRLRRLLRDRGIEPEGGTAWPA